MVDQRGHCFACTDPVGSSAGVRFKRRARRAWPDREVGYPLDRSGRLHLLARSARLSALHLSPCPLHVARDRSSAVAGRSGHGGAHRGRFVRRVCRLAECTAAPRTTLGYFLTSKDTARLCRNQKELNEQSRFETTKHTKFTKVLIKRSPKASCPSRPSW